MAFEWLGEILMAEAYRLGNLAGLMLLLCAITSVFVLLLYYYGYLRSGNAKAAFAATILLLPLLTVFLRLRPQLLGFTFLLIALICLERFRQGRERSQLYEDSGVYGDYLRIMAVDRSTLSLLRKYNIGACLIDRSSPLATLLAAAPDWQRVYADNLSEVFVRQESVEGASSSGPSLKGQPVKIELSSKGYPFVQRLAGSSQSKPAGCSQRFHSKERITPGGNSILWQRDCHSDSESWSQHQS